MKNFFFFQKILNMKNWIPGSKRRRSRLIEFTMLWCGCIRCHIAMSRLRLMNKGIMMPNSMDIVANWSKHEYSPWFLEMKLETELFVEYYRWSHSYVHLDHCIIWSLGWLEPPVPSCFHGIIYRINWRITKLQAIIFW